MGTPTGSTVIPFDRARCISDKTCKHFESISHRFAGYTKKPRFWHVKLTVRVTGFSRRFPAAKAASKRQARAPIIMGSHSFTCHPQSLSQREMFELKSYRSLPQQSPTGCSSFYPVRMEGRVKPPAVGLEPGPSVLDAAALPTELTRQ
jgi:hypothetical protein